jgi:hypothetical protein
MRRVAVASLAAVLGALGCGGADDSTGDQGDADAEPDTRIQETAADTAIEDTTPEAEPDTPPEAEPDVAPEVEADTRPVCTGEEFEPDDTAPLAARLAKIDDCDGSGSTVHGILADADDVDYFHFEGSDTFGCTVDPSASTKQSVQVCVFVACIRGATRVNGCNSGDPYASQAGLHGCCVDGPGEASVDFTCTLVGADDSADVYIRVEDPSASSTCESYDVDYHF